MNISIIIINKDDEGISNTLASLLKNVSKQVEIIVVDASNHRLDWIKERYTQVKWIHYTSKNIRKVSIPEQRNVGIKHSKGEIIVFIDASCTLQDDKWLTHLTNPIIKEKEDIVRGASSYVAEHVTITEEDNGKKYVTESPTLNMAIKRSVFKKIGNFDESFAYGSDMDFSWRATHNGYKIRYVPQASVIHEVSSTKQNMKRFIQYGKARAKLYSKHPYYISRMKNYELKSLAYFFILLFSPIIFIFPYYGLVLLALFLIQIPAGNPTKETTERCAFALGMLQGFFLEQYHKL